MNILMVTKSFPPRYAGASIQALSLSKELQRQGCHVEFVTDNYCDASSKGTYLDITIYKLRTFLESQRLSSLQALLWLLRLICFFTVNRKYDVVFFHGAANLEILSFPYLKMLNKKVILELTLVSNDDPLTLKNRKMGWIFLPCLKCLDKIIPISTKLKELSLEAGISSEKLEVIPVGVDTARFNLISRDAKEALKKELKVDGYLKIFMAVGQLEARKGYEFMLDAWELIGHKFPNAALLIAGPGNDESNPFYVTLLDKIKQKKLKNVVFLGLINNVSQYMQASDCLLHCAFNEGLPNTLLEASLSGLPIVCSKIDGVTSDIIRNSNIGREVFERDPQVFAESVSKMFNERNIQQIDGDIKELRKLFEIRNVASRYMTLFNGFTK